MTREEFKTLRAGDLVIRNDTQRIVVVYDVWLRNTIIVQYRPGEYKPGEFYVLEKEEISLVTEELREAHPELFL